MPIGTHNFSVEVNDGKLVDGHTTADVQGALFGTDDRMFQLRAERSGLTRERVYQATYQAQDGSSNITSVTREVHVKR